MTLSVETIERSDPLHLQPWLISRCKRIFNPASTFWNRMTYLFPRVNPYDLPRGSDITERYGVYTDDSNGIRKTGEVEVRAMYEAAGFVSMEDWRCGPTAYGENWVGVSLVKPERRGSELMIPYAGLAQLNLKDEKRVKINGLIPLDGIGPGKNTLPVSSENGVVTIAMRREGRAFDHAISFYNVKIASGKTDYLRDELIPVAPWCRDRIGLTGLPIDLPTGSGQKSRQLWMLHGVRKTPRGSYDEYEYEYALGLGVRTELPRGRVVWQITEKALYTHDQVRKAIEDIGITPEDRDPHKRVIYSTGVSRTNGHITIALSFGDWATFRVVEKTSALTEAVQRSELIARAA